MILITKFKFLQTLFLFEKDLDMMIEDLLYRKDGFIDHRNATLS